MQEVARQAIREYVENHSRAELLDQVLDEGYPGTPRRWSGSASDLPWFAGPQSCPRGICLPRMPDDRPTPPTGAFTPGPPAQPSEPEGG